MKLTQSCLRTLFRLLALAVAWGAAPATRAQDLQGRIEVRGLMGSATYSVAGGTPAPLRAGLVVPVGAAIKTAPGSAVDLGFSHNAGVARLLQNSTLTVDTFSVSDATPTAPVNLQISLGEGTMLGFASKLSSASKCQVKVSDGIADVSGAKYRLSAKGYLVVVEGKALFVFVPPAGAPVPSELRSPPAVYFSPVEGVRPAPDELVREVVLQTKGKLRG